MAKITFYIPEQGAAKYDLDDEMEISIGRAPDCDIILDHSSVSGHHATIRKIGAGLHILVDNGSTNGIFLEGEQIAEAPLANGASITIGSVPAEYEGDEVTSPVSNAGQPAAVASSSGSSSSGGFGAPAAHVAETSSRPAGFKDLSPVEKIVKKDNLRKIAFILGMVAILSAIALILVSAMMSVA